MAKINLVLADTDNFFLKSFSRYILEHNSAFEINTFTSVDYLMSYISSNSIDLLLIEENMLTTELSSRLSNTLILILDDVSKETSSYVHINKYQKTENFVKEITFRYAESKGDKSLLSESSGGADVISVYSPIGGSGKTTIALALAGALSKNGFKVLYFNMEKFNSSISYLNDNVESISEIFLRLKNKSLNISFEIMKRLGTDECGLKYLGAPDSSMEFNEMSEDEVRTLIDELANIADLDYLIIDLPTEFDTRFMDIVKRSRYVSVIATEDKIGISKINNFMREISIFPDLKMAYDKFLPVVNKSVARGVSPTMQQIWGEKLILGAVPLVNLGNISTVTQLSGALDNYLIDLIRTTMGR